jgi:hypothetical protein
MRLSLALRGRWDDPPTHALGATDEAQKIWIYKRFQGDGARRIRTADLLIANQALCQLSYSPEMADVQVFPAAIGGSYGGQFIPMCGATR